MIRCCNCDTSGRTGHAQIDFVYMISNFICTECYEAYKIDADRVMENLKVGYGFRKNIKT